MKPPRPSEEGVQTSRGERPGGARKNLKTKKKKGALHGK